MYKFTAKIEGLKCPNCERHANEAVKEAFNVKKVTSSHTDNEMVIIAKEDIEFEKLRTVVEEAGYQLLDMKKENHKSFLGL